MKLWLGVVSDSVGMSFETGSVGVFEVDDIGVLGVDAPCRAYGGGSCDDAGIRWRGILSFGEAI